MKSFETWEGALQRVYTSLTFPGLPTHEGSKL